MPFSRVLAALCLVSVSLLAQTPATDPEYRKLRDAQLTESFPIENVSMEREAGEFTFKSGTISFAPAVLGRVTIGVFAGQGEFKMNPAVASEAVHMATIYALPELNESFTRAVFFFTDDTYAELKGNASARPVSSEAVSALKDVRDRLRQRRNDPRSTLEAQLTGEDMDNVEADLLAELYRPAPTGVFNAYITGGKYKDLRFFVRPGGAVPQLASTEEVGLVYVNAGSQDQGVWYLAHREAEYVNGRAPAENKWLVDAEQYRIETTLAKNRRLSAKATVEFKSLVEGGRVLKFGLLPNLRVSSVKAGEQAVTFIQEARDADGSFYAVMPEPLVKDKAYALTIEYEGDNVVSNEGGGNFSIGARSSWYPSLNSFTDQAKYHLTFRQPREFTLVSVGKPMSEKRDGDFTVSEWVSDVPLAVAGFNYGRFKKKALKIEQLAGYDVEAYAAPSLPDYLAPLANQMGGLSPTRMSDLAMEQARVSMLIYNQFFGAAPYGRIAVTQQPEFSFGQSWPGLVYLPMAAFLDGTVRYQLFDGIESGLTDFVQEVTPHEVAHQWWGHMVGWSSYRDQWLSEGFADFSAGLFLQLTEKSPNRYFKYLDDARTAILERNQYGFSANDAGPIHMGLRLNTARTGSAYNKLVYSKGGYVLHMIRRMMYDARTGDQAFMAMMHDFVQSHLYKSASTESFQAIVEKHMTPVMNVTNNGKMDWFFDEWIRGQDVPKYDFTHEIKEEGGKYRFTATITQSGVGETFRMPVPIYLELDNGNVVLLGAVPMAGNSTNSAVNLLLDVKPKRALINANRDILAQK